MPTIKIELEHEVYANFMHSGVDIEKEFKKFLLEHEVLKNLNNSQPFSGYWDALDAEIQTIKTLNSEIFKK